MNANRIVGLLNQKVRKIVDSTEHITMLCSQRGVNVLVRSFCQSVLKFLIKSTAVSLTFSHF